MKHSNILLLLLLCGMLPLLAGAQRRADRQTLSDDRSFSMILLGDPQGYVKYAVNQPILELCTAWIADNIDNLHIRAVLCTGDLVEQNENAVPDSRMLDRTSREMWQASSRAFERLDDRVPYIVSCGNHDYGYKPGGKRNHELPRLLPDRAQLRLARVLRGDLPQPQPPGVARKRGVRIQRSAWGKLLVVTTEFHPRDEVLGWAAKLIGGKTYAGHRVIYMTHGYLTNGKEARHIAEDRYDIAPGNAGAEIWHKLVKPSSNIGLVICGHTANGNGDSPTTSPTASTATTPGRRFTR